MTRQAIHRFGTFEDIINVIVQLIESDTKILKEKIQSPKVLSLEADFSPQAVSIMLCLIDLNCIIVPLTESVAHKKDEFKRIAEVEVSIIVKDENFSVDFENTTATHEILTKLKNENHPGLILFSSESTGENKAAVHDFLYLLRACW